MKGNFLIKTILQFDYFYRENENIIIYYNKLDCMQILTPPQGFIITTRKKIEHIQIDFLKIFIQACDVIESREIRWLIRPLHLAGRQIEGAARHKKCGGWDGLRITYG